MDKISLKAYGKINLALNVGKTRPDGFHDVAMILQSIDLYDEITIEKSDAFRVEVSFDPQILPKNEKPDQLRQGALSNEVPEDERNLAIKAAKLMAKKYGLCPVAIRLVKHIPVAAGLGGGSTDAAGVITGMNQLFALDLSEEEMCKVGEQIGSDVPFCIRGGCCLATGRGEILSPVESVHGLPLVLVKPEFGISTPWSYKSFSPKDNPEADLKKLILVMKEEGSIHSVAANMAPCMKNQLAKAALEAYPVLGEILEQLKEEGALFAMMTGSGPTLFGIFATQEDADKAAASMRAKLPISYCTLSTKTL